MPLFSNIIGFSIFGLATRFLQLGIQKQPQFKSIKGHVIYTMIGSIIGYWLYKIEQKQFTTIKKENEKKLIKKEKMSNNFNK